MTELRQGGDSGVADGGAWPSGSYLEVEGASGSALLVDQRIIYTPLWVPTAGTAAEFDIDLSASGSGGAPVCRLGLYSPGSDGRPNTLVVDAGTVDASVAPGILAKAMSQAVPAGLLWAAVVAQGATVTQPTLRTLAGWSRRVTLTALASTSSRTGYAQTGVAGALPGVATPSLILAVQAPFVALKAA